MTKEILKTWHKVKKTSTYDSIARTYNWLKVLQTCDSENYKKDVQQIKKNVPDNDKRDIKDIKDMTQS